MHRGHTCFGTDTRVLTNHGHLFLDELQELLNNGVEVKYAAYDKYAKRLQYVTGRLLVYPADPQTAAWCRSLSPSRRRGSHCPAPMAPPTEGTNSNFTSIRVTADHDMFVQQATSYNSWVRQNGVHRPHDKVKAGQLLRENKIVRFMTNAALGVQPPFCTYTLADVLRCTLGLPAHRIDPFLELYGFWLGDGTMNYNKTSLSHTRLWGGTDTAQFNQHKSEDNGWLRSQVKRCGLRPDDYRWYQMGDDCEMLCCHSPRVGSCISTSRTAQSTDTRGTTTSGQR